MEQRQEDMESKRDNKDKSTKANKVIKCDRT